MNSKFKSAFIILFLSSCLAFAQKTIEASTILKDIKEGKNITLKDATINGVLDLTYMNEAMQNLPKKKKYSWWNSGDSTNEIKKMIDVKISFINCTFTDDVLAYIPHEESGYTFTASFEDEVIFKNCTFEKKALFKYSKFEENADFSNSSFNDDSTFKYAKFDRESSFASTKFKEIATFKYTKFNRNAVFSGVVFKESADFKYAKFDNGVSFKNAVFDEDLDIKYMNVSGDFDITNMNVRYDIDSKYTQINGKSFSKYLISKN